LARFGGRRHRRDCGRDAGSAGETAGLAGPAIGPEAFEVGDEVRAAFLALDAGNAACFRPSPAGRWLADIYELARQQLHGLGVAAVYGGEFCTFNDPARFFSYRREYRTGRMATLIGLD
jgi:copper oxidase (laccase) domain-containing protein